MEKYLVFARKIEELDFDLNNIIEDSNGSKQLEDFTQQELLEEAKYILGKFTDGGTTYNDSLNSDDAEERKNAKKQVRQLRNYIKKYEVVGE